MFFVYSQTCLNQTVDLPESYIKHTLNKVLIHEIFVNLTCI